MKFRHRCFPVNFEKLLSNFLLIWSDFLINNQRKSLIFVQCKIFASSVELFLPFLSVLVKFFAVLLCNNL